MDLQKLITELSRIRQLAESKDYTKEDISDRLTDLIQRVQREGVKN